MCLPTVFMPFTHTNLGLPTLVCRVKAAKYMKYVIAQWLPLCVEFKVIELAWGLCVGFMSQTVYSRNGRGKKLLSKNYCILYFLFPQ